MAKKKKLIDKNPLEKNNSIVKNFLSPKSEKKRKLTIELSYEVYRLLEQMVYEKKISDEKISRRELIERAIKLLYETEKKAK
jgi:hypothetical protein